jgi:hypothetical protein
MKSAANLTRPMLSEAIEEWKKALARRDHPTDLTWIFEENLCIEPSKMEKGGFHFGFQTKFSNIPPDALEITYDSFCLTRAPIVFYRLGTSGRQSVCLLLCDRSFDDRSETDSFICHDEWQVLFHPGDEHDLEEVTELTRWIRRVKRGRGRHVLDFCMSLESIDEILIYGRQLMPHERFTSRMVDRLRRILRQA